MDLAALGIAFLLGVLSVGAGAVFTAQITEGRRVRDLRRALVAEVDENIRRLNAADASGRLPARVKSSAWDAARYLGMPDALRAVLADAYAAGDELNQVLLLFDATAVALSEARDDSLALERLGRMGTNAKDHAKMARAAFEKARDELKKA